MKQLLVNGVPYDSASLYIYGTKISLGTYNSDTKTLNLNSSWQEEPAVSEWLASYRNGLKAATAVALAKAAEIQKA
jgi:hypothetical protein